MTVTHGPEVTCKPSELGLLLGVLPIICGHEFSPGVRCGVTVDHAIHRGKWKGNEPNHAFLAAAPTEVRLQAIYGGNP